MSNELEPGMVRIIYGGGYVDVDPTQLRPEMWSIVIADLIANEAAQV